MTEVTKRILEDLGVGGFEDEPEPEEQPSSDRWKYKPPGGNRYKPGSMGARMKWKPNNNPRLHPDEQAALAGAQPGGPEEGPPIRMPGEVKNSIRGELAQQRRFKWTPDQVQPQRPTPAQPAAASGLDQIMQQIKDEEARPPHQQNSATIARLKAEAMRLMQQGESLWVRRQADRLLPVAG